MAVLNYLTECHFDFGALAGLGKLAGRLGLGRPFFVSDPGVREAGLVAQALEALGGPPAATFFDTPANPNEAAARRAFDAYRAGECDGLIALGGGSAMDLAKIVGLMACHDGALAQYGAFARGGRRIGPIPPVIAIPTTAGTGSEASVGAVLVLDDGRKETFVSPHLIPRAAICDPGLTLSLPPLLSAATGMDAVTHCLEAVLAPPIHPPAEAVGLDGLARALGQGHLRRVVANGADRDARWQMMMASFEGALAFVKGLGAAHALAHALGRIERLRLHHGALNAVLLPHVVRLNAPAAPEKIARIAVAMGIGPSVNPGEAVAEAIEHLLPELGLETNLRGLGIDQSAEAGAIAYAMADLANLTNPRPMTADDYRALFRAALD